MSYFANRGDQDVETATLTLSAERTILEYDEKASQLFEGSIVTGAPIERLWSLETSDGKRTFHWETAHGPLESEIYSWLTPSGALRMILPDRSDSFDRDDLVRITTEIARATAAELDRAISHCLGRIGRNVKADRVYVFLYDRDRNSVTNTHEWVAAGADPQIVYMASLDVRSLNWFMKAFEDKGILEIPSVAAMPESAREESRLLAEQGIESLLAFAMFDEGHFVGFVGFDFLTLVRRWHRRSIERLRLIAGLLAQTILRARTEQRLRRADELFELVRRATNDIIWDWDLETGKVSRSETLETMIGFAPSEETENVEWWRGRVHADDREINDDSLRHVLQNETAPFFANEYRIRHADGHWVSVLDRGYVVRDENGHPVRMVGVTTDVTDRVQSQIALRESEERLRVVLNNVSDAITLLSENGTILFTSPSSSSVFGYSPREIEGTNLLDLIHAADREKVRLALLGMDDSRRGHVTYRLRHGESGWRTIETVGTDLLENTIVGGVLTVSRDVTGRRRLEQQIERSSRLASLGHLASSIAHEFNNVLMGAQPFVDIIERSDSIERARVAAERIGEALDRGKAISRGILHFARPVSVSLETVDLRSWLVSLEDEIRRIVPPTVDVQIEIPEVSFPSTVDPVVLYQAFLNLVLNARDALESREQGFLKISLREVRQKDLDAAFASSAPFSENVITITHNGPALEPETAEHIFDPMFTTRHGSDAGLGLAVVQQLVTAQGGAVHVESSEAGTTFLIFLRSARERVPLREETQPEEEEIEDRVILLVEDNEIVASGISAVLELEGQKVVLARTGAEALAKIAERVPSVIILDIGLPDMSGLDVFEKVEAVHPTLPVIFSSGHGDQQNLKRYLERPNVEFLLKPYDAHTLMTIVERLLSK